MLLNLIKNGSKGRKQGYCYPLAARCAHADRRVAYEAKAVVKKQLVATRFRAPHPVCALLAAWRAGGVSGRHEQLHGLPAAGPHAQPGS